MKRAAIAILSILVVLLLLIGGVVAWAMTADLRPLVESKASDALGRKVTLESLHIRWGDPLIADLDQLSIANASWGSRPEMATVAHIHAEIDPWSLLHGRLFYRKLMVTQPVIVLERDPEGRGNWKFGGSGGAGALMPKDRTEFPTLLDFALSDGLVTYRTSSGNVLKIALGNIAVQSAGENQPVTISGAGAYQDIPAKVEAKTESFAALRDASHPFSMPFTLSNDDGAIDFNGTMMNPLDVDQAKGTLAIDMKRFGTLLKAFGGGGGADFPMKVAGAFTRNGDHWRLDDAKGALAGSVFGGALALDEGPRGGTDHLGLTARFDRLDLDPVLKGMGSSGSSGDWRSTDLSLPGKTAPAIAADLAAHTLHWKRYSLGDVALKGEVGPAKARVEVLKFALAGAPLTAHATAEQTEGGTHLSFEAGAPGLDLGKLLATLGSPTDQISGEISARVEVETTGKSAGDAITRAKGSAVVAMVGGKVSRDLVEKASTDFRNLFRKGEGMEPLCCMLAVAEMKDGIVGIGPLVLKAPEATVSGGGKVDLKRNTVDLRLRSDPKSSGFFALDLPIAITGTLSAPSAKPAAKSEKPADPPGTNLPPALRSVAEASGCL